MSEPARDIVKELIHGDLDETSYTETITLEQALRNLPLEHSPITSVQSVTIDGSTVTDYSRTHFTLRRNGLVMWPAGAVIVVNYTTGWDPQPLPTEIETAISHIEDWLAGNPQSGIQSASIGPMSTTFRADASNVPQTVKGLLQKWIRPLY
jgi:hypothetical protein